MLEFGIIKKLDINLYIYIKSLMFVNNFSTFIFNNLKSKIHELDKIPDRYQHLKDYEFSNLEIAPWDLYIFKDKKIGEGSFSRVYLAYWRGTFVVAKVMNSKSMKQEGNVLLREIDIMSKLHHPNIVQFLGYVKEPFIIVMEHLGNYNLKDKVYKLNQRHKINIMKDILKGLVYIHNRRPYTLIHRDIKLTNIILTDSKVAKITDFGLSTFDNIGNNEPVINNLNNLNNLGNLYSDELTAVVGTERYLAPEIRNIQTYNNKIDIYSTGVLLYELFEYKTYIPSGRNRWFWAPRIVKNLVKNYMLCENPKDRYSAYMLLNLLNHY